MIRGVGIDMIEVDRVRRILERHGERFMSRILSPRERESIHGDPDQYLASRFACKEAAMKALGTGWARGVRWADIEVTNLPSGQPTLQFKGTAAGLFGASGGRAHISLSHLRGYAVAVVILEEDVS